MSALPADQQVEDASLDAEITGMIAELLEEHGSEIAALRALAHDFLVLLADANRSTRAGSRGSTVINAGSIVQTYE